MKVTKPSDAPPAKLASLESQSQSLPMISGSMPLKYEWILRADLEPSPQLKRLLELAFVDIMTELRNANPESEKLFTQKVSARAMKMAVRERIWTVMVDQIIDTTDIIKDTYYKTYSSENNNDILMKGLEALQGTEFLTVQSDDPEEYFKRNIERLISLKLEEITRKIEEIYTGKVRKLNRKRKHNRTKVTAAAVSTTAMEEISNIQIKTEQAASTENASGVEYRKLIKTEQAESNENAPSVEYRKQIKTEQAESNENYSGVEYRKQIKTEQAESNENYSGVEYRKQIKTEQAESNENDSGIVYRKRIKTEQAESNENDSGVEYRKQIKTGQAGSNKNASCVESRQQIKTEPAESTENASDVESPKVTSVLDPINICQYWSLKRSMNRRREEFVEQFSPVLLKIIDMDETYHKIKADIINETQKKLLGTSDATLHSHQNQYASLPSPHKSPNERISYYVKILGKPSLPDQKAMGLFLDQFKPMKIKKHKKREVLFARFTDKEAYDSILAADGTIIDNLTLDIKINKKSEFKGKPYNPSDIPVTIENQKINESGSERVGVDLDEHIAELLASIIKSEDLDISIDDLTNNHNVKEGNSNHEAEIECVTPLVKQVTVTEEEIIEID